MASCSTASVIAEAQLQVVEDRIAQLLKLKAELSMMVRDCRRRMVWECRVIEALHCASPD